MSSITSLQIGQKKISVINAPKLNTKTDITSSCTAYSDGNWYGYEFKNTKDCFIKVEIRKYNIQSLADERLIIKYSFDRNEATSAYDDCLALTLPIAEISNGAIAWDRVIPKDAWVRVEVVGESVRNVLTIYRIDLA